MKKLIARLTAASLLALSACGEGPAPTFADDAVAIQVLPREAPELGNGDMTPNSVTFTKIATFADGLRQPRDLDFNPLRPDELWVVNNGDDGAVIIFDASQETRTAEHRIDDAADHFMAFPSSISFGAEETTIGFPGTFATCQESRNTYGGQAPPNDFMGPALWSSELSIFAKENPYGLGSHLDMLHGSPDCMGIEWERDNIYWVFGGKRHDGGGGSQRPIPAIVKYDFGADHGVGEDDHADGSIFQYVTAEVLSVPGIPSHLALDREAFQLYIADTGNARIAALDTRSGTIGRNLTGQEPLHAYKMMDDAILVDVVNNGELVRPSGLALKNDLLYVSDNATGILYAFNKAGEKVNQLDTGLGAGALAGIAFGPDDKLYLVDMLGNEVLRVDP